MRSFLSRQSERFICAKQQYRISNNERKLRKTAPGEILPEFSYVCDGAKAGLTEPCRPLTIPESDFVTSGNHARVTEKNGERVFLGRILIDTGREKAE